MLAAASPEVVTVDQLHDAMWDGAPPPSVRKSLQVHVTRLRGALEPDRPSGSPGRYVARRQRGYALVVPRDRLDATAFEDEVARGRALLAADDPAAAKSLLTRALGRWRGTPYADWPDVPALAPVRARLEGIHAYAIEAFWEAELALGRHVEAVPELERLVAEQPLHEHAWGLLVLALYRSGRQGDPLDAVRRARDELRESLGVDPGPELRELEQAVLAQDPSLVTTVGVRTEATAGSRSLEPAVSGCPYKGLTRYEVDDAAIFRGRDRLVDALVVTLVDHEVVVVSGSSGAGKSSLVRAGLIPALAAGAVPGSEHWEPVVVVPGPSLVDDLAGLVGEQPPERPVVLVCDQLEQLWSSSTPPEERSAFLDTVIGLVEDGVAARCVLVVRGDHVGRLAEHADLAQRISGGGLALVTGMSELELRAVVVEPAEAAGLRVESDLVDVAVREVIGRAGSLPLLSTALAQTWAHRREGTMSLAAYLATGGVSGAVGRSAEQVYSSFSEAERQQARAVMVRLAEQGPDGTVLARSLPAAELEAAEAGTAAVVRTLVDHRLVTRDNDRLDVAHESLLTAWPRLASWLEDDAVGRAVRGHLAPAALEWDTQGRPADELYRGARLQAAAEWVVTPDSGATPVERAFVEAGLANADAELDAARQQAEAEAAGRRRTRRLAGVLAGVLVLAVASAVVAVLSQRRADEEATVADANRLAALSSSARSLDLSLLLAVAAVRTAATPATEDGLLRALVEHRRATGVHQLAAEAIEETALSADGQSMAIGIGGGSPRVLAWRRGDPEPPVAIAEGDWGPEHLAISPDGDTIVGVNSVPTLRAFTDGERLRIRENLDALGGYPRDVAYTPEGRLLMFVGDWEGPRVGYRGRLARVDLASGEVSALASIRRSTHSRDGSIFFEAAFTDDASVLVAWTSDHRHAYRMSVPGGRYVPLKLEPRSASSLEFVATPSGALQLWSDGAVTRYDRRGRAVQLLDVHRARVRDARVLPGGRAGVTLGDDGQVELWSIDRRTGSWSHRESLEGHVGAVQEVEVAADGGALLTADRDGQLITWDMTDEHTFGTTYPGLSGRWVSHHVRVVDPADWSSRRAGPAVDSRTAGPLGAHVSRTPLTPLRCSSIRGRAWSWTRSRWERQRQRPSSALRSRSARTGGWWRSGRQGR